MGGSKVERVGFVGLGDMGEPMARNLCGAFEVVVRDLRAEPVRRLEAAGAESAASARELAAHSQVMGVCVLDDAATETLVAGEDGLLAGAARGAVIAIHGTVHPDTVRRLAERARSGGVDVIDAQITGGRALAEARKLRYMVGGDAGVVERCRPVFETSAETITHCGPVGAGAVAKLCNNLVQFQAWHAYVEAFALAGSAGLEEQALLDVLAWIMNDNARSMLAGRTALQRDPENAFLRERFASVRVLAEKDLSLALELAREAGVAMPGTELCVRELARLFPLPRRERP